MAETQPSAEHVIEVVGRRLCEAKGEAPDGVQSCFVAGQQHAASLLDIAKSDVRTILWTLFEMDMGISAPLSQDDAQCVLYDSLREMRGPPTDDKALIDQLRQRGVWLYRPILPQQEPLK